MTSINAPDIRPGTEADLDAIMDIWYANEVLDDPHAPPRPPILSDYPHLVRTGDLWIAERAGQPVGFSGAVVRGETVFLTDLFVHPDHQSSGLGARLLDRAFAGYSSLAQFTVSSSDPRALALYIRAGMQPRWPNFLLRAHRPRIDDPATDGIHAHIADVGDPMFGEWDTRISGRGRPQDLAFWVREDGGVPLWLLRGGAPVGYAVVRIQRGESGLPDAARVGPTGARRPEDAAGVLAAAAAWAAQQAPNVRLDALGAHPGLDRLLRAGFQISYVETFMLRASAPFFNPRCYSGSGGALC